MPLQTKKIKTGKMYRSFDCVRSEIDEEKRTVPLAFSSEDPYPRWFGIEILDHKKSSIRLGRLKNKAPLLVDHNMSDQIGVVEDVTIGTDKVGRSVVRFGNSARAEEIFRDVLDEVRTKVSVGYRIHKMILEETSDEGKDDVYRVVDWEPLEISIVSIAADDTVGVGRSDEEDEHEVTILKKEADMPDDTPAAPSNKDTPPAFDQERFKKDVTESAVKSAQAVIAKEREADAQRVREIKAIGEHHNLKDMALDHIAKGTSLDEFRAIVLEKIAVAKPVETPGPGIGMDNGELKKYSVLRAILAASKQDWSKAGLEKECSDAVAEKLGRTPNSFFLPHDVVVDSRDFGSAIQYAREMSVGVATAGGNLVDTELRVGSFIDMLRNRMRVRQLGATILSGLQGDLAIPKQTGGAIGYWLSEGQDTTPSDPAIGQVALIPKTVAGLTEYTRKLMQQTSIDMENFVRLDLATCLALAMDLSAITGDGTGNTPVGIMNQAGVGLVAMGTDGLAPTYASTVDLETEVAIDNGDIGTMAYLTNTKVRGKMKQTPLEAGYPKYVWEKGNAPGVGEVNGYPAAVSNHVPWNLDKGLSVGVCSAMIFGVWSQLLIGLWGGLDILVDPYTKSASGGMRVVAFQDSDIATRHAESFSVVKDYLI